MVFWKSSGKFIYIILVFKKPSNNTFVLINLRENGNIITKMYSGDFFGEIGILNLEGASNR